MTDPLTVNRVLSVIAETGMLENGDSVVVAVSGGCDSSALLDILVRLQKPMNLRLLCAHVNHNLRGDESRRDEAFVRETCERLSVPFRLLSTDVSGYAAEHHLSTEEAGREIRYAFFEHCAEELGSGAKIATAHTLSDNAETVLFRLARGAALPGLCGIPPIRGRIIRPLLSFSREEIENYCKENGVPFVTDSTNFSDDYARNRLRHRVVPVLRELNPAFEKKLFQTAKSLGEARDFLNECAEQLLETAGTDGGLSVSVLKKARPAVRKTAILLFLERNGFSVDFDRVETVSDALGTDFRWEWKKDYYLCEKDGLLFAEEKATPEAAIIEQPFRPGKIVLSSEKTAEIRLLYPIKEKNSYKVYGYSLKNSFDYGKIQGVAILRSRKAGDKVDVHGGTKTLKKLFNEGKIAPERRDSQLVIADDQGILWVEGFGAAKRARLSEETNLVAVVVTASDIQKTSSEDSTK